MVKRKITYLVLGGLLIFTARAWGQFAGGGSDGYGSGRTLAYGLAQPDIYCSGGDADGQAVVKSALLYLGSQDLYTSGGSGGGFAGSFMPLSTLNEQSPYCVGGNSDGQASSNFAGFAFDPYIYCSGGTGDGLSQSDYQGIMYDQYFCLGGSGDGSDINSSGMTSPNLQAFYCSAADGDGFHLSGWEGSFMSYVYCRGGDGDGQHVNSMDIYQLGNGIWTGEVSSEWDLAANWKNNVLPVSTSNVLIRAGCTHYPVLDSELSINSAQGQYQCKRMDIHTGGSLLTTFTLTLNGRLKVNGVLNFQSRDGSNIMVLSNGILSVGENGSFSVLP